MPYKSSSSSSKGSGHTTWRGCPDSTPPSSPERNPNDQSMPGNVGDWRGSDNSTLPSDPVRNPRDQK